MADLPENVKLFPGVAHLPAAAAADPEKPKGPTPAKLLLKTALALEARDLVVIGILPDGELYIGSQSEDALHVTGLLSKAVTWMTLPEEPEYEVEDDYEDDDPPAS